MKPRYNPDIHKRKSIRLKYYDYSSVGFYFVTICCFNRLPLFGNIENGIMKLNECGKIAHNEWIKTFEMRTNLEIDEFVIMPNHVHLIVYIKENNHQEENVNRPFRSPSDNLGSIIRGYKSAVSQKLKDYIPHPIWQRNYYEHIIRDEHSYQMIWDYVVNNPLLWEKDCFYLNVNIE